MSDLMNSVFGHAGNEPREAGGTDTIEAERTTAFAPVPADTEQTDAEQADDVVAGAEAATEDETRPAPESRGDTTVGDAVVTKVVNKVAREADGVHRLDEDDSEVVVDGRVTTIRISLVVEYGQAVTTLAKRIRTDVIDAVEDGLGLDVEAVDIHVGDIHTEDDDDTGTDDTGDHTEESY